jgi:hypothetical protein
MSGSYLVTTGPAKQLTGAALDNGSIIVNRDPTNSVWVDDKPSVVPGAGTLVPALGMVQWRSQRGIWAVLDAGVTQPVLLMISDEITDYADPEAVAIATATQLLATGVPNVLIEDTLIPGTILSANQAITVDISKYSSFTVQALGTQPAGSLCDLIVSQSADSGNLLVLDSEFCYAASFASGYGYGNGTWRFAAVGKYLTIQNSPNSKVSVTVIASNRAATKRVDSALNTNNSDQWLCTLPGAMSNGQIVPFFQETANINSTGYAAMYCRFGIANNAARIEMVVRGKRIIIGDTKQFYANTANTYLIYQGFVVLPTNPYWITFVSAAAQTATNQIQIDFIPV